jgi:hypothetical protein
MAFCLEPPASSEETTKRIQDLRRLFNGETITDVDGKPRYIGKGLNEVYGDVTDGFGESVFRNIVMKTTQRPVFEGMQNFTKGDFRRTANEIERESKQLDRKGLNAFQKLFYVKRASMNKYANTRILNQKINNATNYERTKYSEYISANDFVSRLIRTEIVSRGGQSKFLPGIKTVRQLDNLEGKLAAVLSKPKNERDLYEANQIRDELSELYATKGYEVLNEFREYLEAPKAKGETPVRPDGTTFSTNVILAGEKTRELLNSMGDVFINGLKEHKNLIRMSYLGTAKPGKGWELTFAGKKVKAYEDFLAERIKDIEEGMKDGDYYPHYLLETLVRLESTTREIDNNVTSEQRMSDIDANLGNFKIVLDEARSSMGRLPQSVKGRKVTPYENFVKNPLGVLRKYSLDAISFNKNNRMKTAFLEAVKHLPKDADVAEGLRDYLDDVYTVAGKGYTERPSWVNKTVRVITGFEFFSKIGFGVTTAARNTLSGMYYVQSVGNRAFAQYLKDWNKDASMQLRIQEIEQDQGFRFEDLSSSLFTEGLLPTKGVNQSDVKMEVIDGKPVVTYREGGAWKVLDSSLTWATGKSAIFQKWTENFLRKHMFRYSFISKFNEIKRNQGGSLDKKQEQAANTVAKDYALDIVNKYAFEYAAHQKAPIIGGTSKKLGAFGQVAAQFFHYPFSFLNLQAEVLKNSKDAVMARQWDSPDMMIPVRFAALYLFTEMMSGVMNLDFHRLMENDTVERIVDLKNVLDGDKDVKGRGYLGPGVGELFFYATMYDFIRLPDNELTNLIVGYNDAYDLTDKEKSRKILSSLNVQVSKIVHRDWPALQNGNGLDLLMYEFGVYPRSWTKRAREKFPLNLIFPKPKKQLEEPGTGVVNQEKELQKLYRAMGI